MVKALQVFWILLLITVSTPSYADTVYVSDSLRVGVRTEPENRGETISVAVTGMSLEVLDRRGNYMLVRTSNGIEGWVNSNYVSRKKPAKLLLEGAEKENERLTKKVNELQSSLEDLEYAHAKLNDQHEELMDKNTKLQKQLDATFNPAQIISGENRPLWQSLLLLLLVILLSVGLGILIHRRQLTKKLGGMTL
jgi:SH3 domain protein